MLLWLAHTLCPICHSFGTVPNFHTKKRRINQGNSSRPTAFSFTRGISSTPWGFVRVEGNQWDSTFISKLYCRRSYVVQTFFTLSYDLLRRGQQCSVQHIKNWRPKPSKAAVARTALPQIWGLDFKERLIHKWSQSICFSQAMFVPRKARLHTCKNAVETNLIKALGRQPMCHSCQHMTHTPMCRYTHTHKTIRLMTWANIEAEAAMARGPTAELQEKKHSTTKHLKG